MLHIHGYVLEFDDIINYYNNNCLLLHYGLLLKRIRGSCVSVKHIRAYMFLTVVKPSLTVTCSHQFRCTCTVKTHCRCLYDRFFEMSNFPRGAVVCHR